MTFDKILVAFPQAAFADGSKRKESFMKLILKKEVQDFIAKYIGDLSKAIVTIGFASHFFKESSIFWRVGFYILASVFFVTSVIIIEKGE